MRRYAMRTARWRASCSDYCESPAMSLQLNRKGKGDDEEDVFHHCKIAMHVENDFRSRMNAMLGHSDGPDAGCASATTTLLTASLPVPSNDIRFDTFVSVYEDQVCVLGHIYYLSSACLRLCCILSAVICCLWCIHLRIYTYVSIGLDAKPFPLT